MTFDLSRYGAAVFDLDGTVWLSGEPIPGAVDFLERCRSLGIVVAFATNISLESVEQIRSKLIACGLARPGELVVTSGLACTNAVASAGIHEVAALCSAPLQDSLRDRGITVTPVAAIDRGDWRSPQPGRAVVMTGLPSATLAEMETVGQLAAWGHPWYISSKDPGFPGKHGIEPGAGMMVAAVTALHRVEPIVTGKPSPEYAGTVLDGLAGVGPVVMFGDSQRADIGLARLLGADGVLITGTSVTGLAPDLPSPDYVTSSLAERPVEFEGGMLHV